MTLCGWSPPAGATDWADMESKSARREGERANPEVQNEGEARLGS